MKNSQKGSATTWVILVVVIILIGVGAFLALNYHSSGCAITDSNGNTTYGPCPTTAPGTIVTTAQSDYDKVGQAMKNAASQTRSVSPSGYLVPTAPAGYMLSSVSPQFTTDTASYLFKDAAGDTIYFIEAPGSYSDAVSQLKAEGGYQLLDTVVSYNGGEATVYYHHTTLNGKSSSSLQLIYDHNGDLVTITSNGPDMSAKDLENILKSATVAK